MTTKTDFVSQEWEKRFDEQFTVITPNRIRVLGAKVSKVKLKDFIRQLLSQSYQQGFNDALKRVGKIADECVVEFHGAVDVTGIIDETNFRQKLSALRKEAK